MIATKAESDTPFKPCTRFSNRRRFMSIAGSDAHLEIPRLRRICDVVRQAVCCDRNRNYVASVKNMHANAIGIAKPTWLRLRSPNVGNIADDATRELHTLVANPGRIGD